MTNKSYYNYMEFDSDDQEYDTLQRMHAYGGSFVRQLAILYESADPTNKFKLRMTFQNYFIEYRDWEEKN